MTRSLNMTIWRLTVQRRRIGLAMVGGFNGKRDTCVRTFTHARYHMIGGVVVCRHSRPTMIRSQMPIKVRESLTQHAPTTQCMRFATPVWTATTSWTIIAKQLSSGPRACMVHQLHSNVRYNSIHALQQYTYQLMKTSPKQIWTRTGVKTKSLTTFKMELSVVTLRTKWILVRRKTATLRPSPIKAHNLRWNIPHFGSSDREARRT